MYLIEDRLDGQTREKLTKKSTAGRALVYTNDCVRSSENNRIARSRNETYRTSAARKTSAV